MIDRQSIPRSHLERAARFFYLQKITFGGKVSGRSFGVSATESAAFDVTRIIPELEAYHERLSGVVVERLPYAKCIARYDRPTTLFFLDPRYLGTEHYYGPDMFTRADFDTLAAQLRTLKGKFVLTVNDTPDTRSIAMAALSSSLRRWARIDLGAPISTPRRCKRANALHRQLPVSQGYWVMGLWPYRRATAADWQGFTKRCTKPAQGERVMPDGLKTFFDTYANAFVAVGAIVGVLTLLFAIFAYYLPRRDPPENGQKGNTFREKRSSKIVYAARILAAALARGATLAWRYARGLASKSRLAALYYIPGIKYEVPSAPEILDDAVAAELRESNIFFSERFADAFPAISNMTSFTRTSDIAHRLDILLRPPLTAWDEGHKRTFGTGAALVTVEAVDCLERELATRFLFQLEDRSETVALSPAGSRPKEIACAIDYQRPHRNAAIPAVFSLAKRMQHFELAGRCGARRGQYHRASRQCDQCTAQETIMQDGGSARIGNSISGPDRNLTTTRSGKIPLCILGEKYYCPGAGPAWLEFCHARLTACCAFSGSTAGALSTARSAN